MAYGRSRLFLLSMMWGGLLGTRTGLKTPGRASRNDDCAARQARCIATWAAVSKINLNTWKVKEGGERAKRQGKMLGA